MRTQFIARALQGRWLAGGLVMAAALSLLASAPTWAAGGTEITLSPTSSRITLSPGEVKDGTFVVLNSGTTAFDMTVYARPYQVTNEAYEPDFEQVTARTEVARWISFEQERYHLEPRQQVEVRYRVQAPASIPDGTQAAALFAEADESTVESQRGSITAKKRVGMLLYARSSGHTTEEGRLLGSSVAGWWQTQPITVMQRVADTGNTELSVRSRVTAYDLFGNQVAQSQVEHTLLPRSTRAIPIEISGLPTVGLFRFDSQASLLSESATVTHLVLLAPIPAVVLSALVLAAAVGGIAYAIRRSRRRHVHFRRR